jgi:hypothetical protein
VVTPGNRDPRWVDAILDWRGTWFLARVGLTGAFLLGGFTKLLNFQRAMAEQAHFGLTRHGFGQLLQYWWRSLVPF